MPDLTPAVFTTYRRPVRYRAEQLSENHFGVVERATGNIVAAGFTSYKEAWAFIVNRLGPPND